MGSTVTCGKRVAAFRDPRTCEVVYVLFESTYEKNCYPHTPHESATGFGVIEAVLKRIFAMASSCEGGMLQGPSGQILPENYIAGWMKALAAPVKMDASQIVTLSIGKGMYSFDDEKRDQIIAALRIAGDNEGAKALTEGQSIRRQLCSPAVAAVMEIQQTPWRFELNRPFGAEEPSLAYNPKPRGTSPLVLPRVASLPVDHSGFFVLDENGWTGCGDRWQKAERFVAHLWENELAFPGTYRTLIRRFREEFLAAPVFGSNAVLQLLSSDSCPSWIKDRYQALLRDLGFSEGGTARVGEVVVKLQSDQSMAWRFRSVAEAGLISLGYDAPLVARLPDPKFDAPKPAQGLEVDLGAVRYRLVRPEGPRRGWIVERLSDGQLFRMPAKQLAGALRDIAIRKARQAREAISAVSKTISFVPQEQSALF